MPPNLPRQKEKVTVDLKKKDGRVLLSVTDTGIGMSEEDISKLFRIDGQLVKEGTGGEVGTGLGLLLCKEYIEKNNGKIWAESKVDKGSTFHIILPEGS
ncbi:MAG: ATP-binding protein [Bacteroidales bacterium]